MPWLTLRHFYIFIMKYYNYLSTPVDVTVTFAPARKHINPFVGGALIGAGANLLGGLFGKKSNDDTNATNLKIAQMNNEFNERMLNKQLQYNTDMYDRQFADNTQTWKDQYAAQQSFQTKMQNWQNQYNSAFQQRQRLEAAGLNPYLMMNGGSAGTASSAGGSLGSSNAAGSPLSLNTPTASEAGRQLPYDPTPSFTGAAGVIQTLMDIQAQKGVRQAQADKLNADARLAGIDAFSRSDINQATLNKLLAEISTSKSVTKLNKFELSKATAMLPADLAARNQEVANLKATETLTIAQSNLADIQTQLAQKDLNTYDERFQASLSVMSAQVYQYMASGRASEKQIDLYAEQILKTRAETDGVRLNNKQVKELMPIIVDTAKETKRRTQNEATKAEYDAIHSYNNRGSDDVRQYNHAMPRGFQREVLTAIKNTIDIINPFKLK